MDRDEGREVPEVEKRINAWRQSERKVMIDTIQDLIEMSHKYAKSQYTPSNQRSVDLVQGSDLEEFQSGGSDD